MTKLYQDSSAVNDVSQIHHILKEQW